MTENKVTLHSMQKGIIVHHAGNPNFEFAIHDHSIKVDRKIAEFLVKDKPKMFKIIGDKPKKKSEVKTP